MSGLIGKLDSNTVQQQSQVLRLQHTRHRHQLVETQSTLFSSLTDNDNSSSSYDEECDVLVLGSGPAARAIATLLSSPKSSNLNVILSDSNYDRDWAPNYGVWEDEWQSIVTRYNQEFGRTLIEECIDRKWSVTDCYFGGSFDIPTEERLRIDRPYYRVDKYSLKDTLSPPKDEEMSSTSWYKVLKANHVSEALSTNMYSPSGSLVHDERLRYKLLIKHNQC